MIYSNLEQKTIKNWNHRKILFWTSPKWKLKNSTALFYLSIPNQTCCSSSIGVLNFLFKLFSSSSRLKSSFLQGSKFSWMFLNIWSVSSKESKSSSSRNPRDWYSQSRVKKSLEIQFKNLHISLQWVEHWRISLDVFARFHLPTELS